MKATLSKSSKDPKAARPQRQSHWYDFFVRNIYANNVEVADKEAVDASEFSNSAFIFAMTGNPLTNAVHVRARPFNY
ncbi:MAG: hypothetical protein HZB26_05395 [Candidatus Hydrogenedentes bacterium]|nr:hypothetical protein [Candidatus Hydrogenedentota bacterium]